MEQYDFTLYDLNETNLQDNFIIIQSGKGKKKNTSIKLDAKAFSFVEGLIWNKYREYGNESKTRILSSEWPRILNGFQDAVDDLEVTQKENELDDILKFEIFKPKYEMDDILQLIEQLKKLIVDLITWISKKITEEKYIYIIKTNSSYS